EVLARFEQRLELLTGGGRDLPSRHQTLRGAIDWSHELLEPDAQLLMSRLAVFSHGWTLAAAEAVAADPQDPLRVVEGLASLADALPRFWSIRGHMPEGRAWLELALGQPADVPAAIRARALFASGYAALGLGDFGAALQRFEEALRLFRELDDARGVAPCLAQLGWLATTRDDHERAVSVSQESLTLARDLGDKRTASVALSNLA